MKLYIFEGTPQEISEVIPDFNAKSPAVFPSAAASTLTTQVTDDSEPLEPEYVSLQVAREVLKRRKLSKEQLLVLKEIYKAFPNPVTGVDLQARIGYDRPQFSGLMGAFGRRYSHTDGFIPNTWFFEQKWDDEAKSHRYGLPETVREAMRLEKLV
jgi:hypothetical protein